MLVQILGYSLFVDSVLLLLEHIYSRWIYEANQVAKLLVYMIKWIYFMWRYKNVHFIYFHTIKRFKPLKITIHTIIMYSAQKRITYMHDKCVNNHKELLYPVTIYHISKSVLVKTSNFVILQIILFCNQIKDN